MKVRSTNAGMTMIELVSALMLFLLILGGLTLALNKATSLWNVSHSSQNEQEQTDLILNMLTDDLRQAVADTGTVNSGNRKPSFICDTNETGGVTTLLQFVRLRSDKSSFNSGTPKPPFLDAVFYTCYSNMLFRHIAPLKVYSSVTDPRTIGDLLEILNGEICTEQTHLNILTFLNDPLNSSKPSQPGEFSLLASYIEQPLIFGGISAELVTSDDKTAPPIINEQKDNIQITSPPVYYKFATTALPDYLDIEIRAFSEKDWSTYRQLKENASEDDFARRSPSLGVFRSKRIFLTTAKAARLP